MENVKDRKRFVDVDKLDDSKVDEITMVLSDKIRQIVDKACENVNKLLNVYGLRAKMQIAFEKIESQKE